LIHPFKFMQQAFNNLIRQFKGKNTIQRPKV